MTFIEQLKLSPDMHHLEPATEESVQSAEKKLGVCFSPDYRTYILALGVAAVGDHEFTGICASSRLNVTDVTLHERQKCPHECDAMYVVERLHIDHIVIWQDHDGLLYQSMPGSPLKKIASSLTEYLTTD